MTTDTDIHRLRRRRARGDRRARSTPRSTTATPTSTGASTTASSRSNARTAASSSSTATCPTARSGWRRAPAAFTSAATAGRWRDTRCAQRRAAATAEALVAPAAVAPHGSALARTVASRRIGRADRCSNALRGVSRPASSAVQSSSSRRSAAWPGHQRLDDRPEARRVIELDQVRDLVRDDVFGERRRQLHEPPVEADLAARVAASPFAARVGQAQRRAPPW